MYLQVYVHCNKGAGGFPIAIQESYGNTPMKIKIPQILIYFLVRPHGSSNSGADWGKKTEGRKFPGSLTILALC